MGYGVIALAVWAVSIGLWTTFVQTNPRGPDLFAAIVWQVAAFGLSSLFVWGIRWIGEKIKLPYEHLPRASDPINKPIRIAIFHGSIERVLFTVLAIAMLRPTDIGNLYPDPTTSAGLLVAAALYLTLRERSADVKDKLSIFSSWNMAFSIAVGVAGGWMWWHPQILVKGYPF